jgi:spore maturation protein CgeD
MAKVSIIIVSHDKPRFVNEAVQSVLTQTMTDWEALLIDSGVLFGQGFFADLKDPRMKVSVSGETRELARTKNMASWCFNKALNSGQLTGDLILYLNDDDLLYPEAFETFWHCYDEHNREPQAMYSSQDLGVVGPDGKTKVVGTRRADRPAGRFCRGRRLDCEVDYLQFCHTKAILDKFRSAYKTDEIHSEDKQDAHHADGIFMEQVGALTKVYNIDKVLSMNRRTMESANLEYATSFAGRILATLKAKLRFGLRRSSGHRRY